MPRKEVLKVQVAILKPDPASMLLCPYDSQAWAGQQTSAQERGLQNAHDTTAVVDLDRCLAPAIIA